MSLDADALFDLLPALYRLRDDEAAGPDGRGPLRRLLAVIAEQAAALEADLDQLHDDLFVETCAPWVLPYLADLVGLSGLPNPAAVPARGLVAGAVGHRRRKGTAAGLERLAYDAAGWPARVVEFFALLATTQNVNHVRPAAHAFAAVRDADRLEFLNGPFEAVGFGAAPAPGCEAGGRRRAGRPARVLGDFTHTADVRTIGDGRGRYNLPNVGVFAWPSPAYPLTRSPAVPAFPDDRRHFHFHPLGVATPLFSLPRTEPDPTALAGPLDVPAPISRRLLLGNLPELYPRSIAIEIAEADADGDVVADPVPKALDAVVVSELGDVTDAAGTVVGWSRAPTAAGTVAIDPQLGRLALAEPLPANQSLLVTYHYGFTGDLGGGEYERTATLAADLRPVEPVAAVLRQPPLNESRRTIQEALDALPASGGVVEVRDNGRYDGPAGLDALARPRVEIRAAGGRRPVLEWPGPGPVAVAGGLEEGRPFVELTLNGFLLVGATLAVRDLARLRLRHCTLVPGLRLLPDGTPAEPEAPSLIVATAGIEVEIDGCILGGLRVHRDSSVVVRDSILDAGGLDRLAYGAPAPTAGAAVPGAGGRLRLENVTALGRVVATVLPLASNSLIVAEAAEDGPPVIVERRQEGCVRFSYLPPGALVPRRHRCLPTLEAPHGPTFVSTRYGDPGYARLSPRSPAAIRRGADDEGEMGAFHGRFAPLREDHLRARVEESLRFGLAAGVITLS